MKLTLWMSSMLGACIMPMVISIAIILPVSLAAKEPLPPSLQNNTGSIKEYQSTIPVLPMPKHIEQFETQLLTSSISRIVAANGLPSVVKENIGWHWNQFQSEIITTPSSTVSIEIGLLGKDKSFDARIAAIAASWIKQIGNEGYILILHNKQRILAARTEAGLFYGLQTIKQLVRAGWKQEIVLADWPTFTNRVIYDDISRGPISTVDYIKKQIERMAEIKINALSFYIEHIVQPVSHPDFAPADGKLTIAQIKELSAYAKKFHMQLIGSFQSFGHFEKILSLPQYASLGATSTLVSPTNPVARQFLKDVIGELCDAFDSPWFNVNCDETFDLGQGTTKPYVDSMGAAAFYASHLRFLYDIVRQHGKKMMMWGDFALQHPEVLDMLPKDITYLTWEYGDQPSYDHWIKPFTDRHLSYMVCPGILNSYRMFPDMMMAKENIAGFSKAGSVNGATGVITTIWDDGGTYLFSADWYGVYVAAEKSWTTDTTTTASFNTRYEQTAYGTHNDNYVKALFKLMELRRLPLTYDLNDRLWQQKILPDSNKKMILNNTSADMAMHILHDATGFIAAANPQRNKTDISTLAFSIDQYQLMIETRLQIAAIAEQYRQALTLSVVPSFDPAIADVTALTEKYKILESAFKNAWLNENQLYWLDITLAPYEKKIKDLSQLKQALMVSRERLSQRQPLPPALQARLAIEVSDNFYFQNWMITGPFPVAEQFPAFLYSDSKEYNKPPSPGDFTQYQGKLYRWRKFVSPDGGIVDPDQVYDKTKAAFLYAYCSVTTGETASVPAYLKTINDAELYCNGKKITQEPNSDENKLLLPLKKGINYILIKLKQQPGSDNSFTFRLDKKEKVTNHKHKYQLNAKTESYDAE